MLLFDRTKTFKQIL